jgi:metal-responsive CopG/Arc/MetJ family transcriptional regulator
MKTAISIPDSQFKAAERLARRLGVNRSELYRTAIADFVTRHSAEAIASKLNIVYGNRGESSSLSAELERMQAKSISEEDW